MDKRTTGYNKIATEIKDYVFITLGLLLYAFAWTLFLLPNEIVTGGVTGIAAIVYYTAGVPVEYTYLGINAVLLLLALHILGRQFIVKTVYATLVLSLALRVARAIMTGADGRLVNLLGEGQEFMSIIIGCTLIGIALATVFLHNGSTGGTDIIAAAVNKFKPVSLGHAIIIADLVIICSSMINPVFGDMLSRCHKVVFGLCAVLVEGFTLDYVMNSRRESVQFLIFSRKYQQIADAIGTRMNRGITILDGHGWYTGNEVKVLCVITKKTESVRVLRIIKAIDSHAFVSQGSVVGTYGEGFDRIKVKARGDEAISTVQPTFTSKPRIVFATNNKHKLEEISDIIGSRAEIISLSDIGCHEDIPETADTIEGNALMKARYIHDRYRVDCFADDTGLEVEALGGAPGVMSARYAGEGHDSEANIDKLLANMEGKTDRRARFRTVIALVREENGHTVEHMFTGKIEGIIATERAGKGGFGYDPIFIPDGYDNSFAELGADLKNKISHRARATARLAAFLLKTDGSD